MGWSLCAGKNIVCTQAACNRIRVDVKAVGYGRERLGISALVSKEKEFGLRGY